MISMEIFKKTSISSSSEIIAKELKRAREARGIGMVQVAGELNISRAYLEALERGDFEALPIGVYRANFLREYVYYLGLSWTEFSALYADAQGEANLRSSDLFVRRARNVRFSLVIPRILKGFAIFGVSALCIAYLGLSLNEIIAAPVLDIESPSFDTVIDEKEIVVRGVTVPEAKITINDELVLADEHGAFSKPISLKSGLNTIVITAQKKYSRTSETIKKVFVSES